MRAFIEEFLNLKKIKCINNNCIFVVKGQNMVPKPKNEVETI